MNSSSLRRSHADTPKRGYAPTRIRGYADALLFGVLLALVASPAWAQDAAKVRTSLEVKGDVWVRQRVTLVVELLSPGFFAGSPTFYLPRVPEALILQPNKRPVLASEVINGYTSQRREFALIAQRRAITGSAPPSWLRRSLQRGRLNLIAGNVSASLDTLSFFFD